MSLLEMRVGLDPKSFRPILLRTQSSLDCSPGLPNEVLSPHRLWEWLCQLNCTCEKQHLSLQPLNHTGKPSQAAPAQGRSGLRDAFLQ